MAQAPARRDVRSYNQHCTVARSLDVLGERWTLLIVRDLLIGPKRYKDLLLGLPTIGTNLLAARLRELEEYGMVHRRVLPPPAGSTVYELTPVGQALEPIVLAIGRWGERHLAPARRTDILLPTAFFVGLRMTFRPEAAAGLITTYALRVGDQLFEVRVANGRCTTTEGRTTDPDVLLTLDIATLHALTRQGLTPQAALASGQVILEGDPRALDRFVEMFAVR
jgi:DNA-binding HxlR family transcriptional regulator